MIPLRDANPTRRTPVVTLALVIACFVAFAWELGLMASGGEAALDGFITTWGVVPADLTAAWARGDYLSHQTATLLTSQFLHGSWLHLLGNMLYLWIFGNNVEDRFGRLGFLGFYLLGGALAAVSQVVIDPSSAVPTIGASGAIAATLGAYLVLFPRARVTTLVFLGFFYQLIDVPAIIVLGFWFVLQLIDGLTSLGAIQAGGGVAFFAHIGGFVVGALLARIAIGIGGRLRRPATPPTVG
ncbi:MAG: rhomboid family intramembrane serine protease [Chloroflexota bacterium]